MYRKVAALVVSIAIPQAAGAFDLGTTPAGTIDVYATPRVSLKTENGAGPDTTNLGDGAGFRATAKVIDWFGVIAEFQNTAIKETAQGPFFTESSGTRVEYRVGPGYLHESGSGVFAEYKTVEIGDVTTDGFGIRGRLGYSPREGTNAHLEVGHATLESDDDSGAKFKDFHIALGGAVRVTGPWSLFAEYRLTQQTNDVDDLESTQEDFRLGVRANLDY